MNIVSGTSVANKNHNSTDGLTSKIVNKRYICSSRIWRDKKRTKKENKPQKKTMKIILFFFIFLIRFLSLHRFKVYERKENRKRSEYARCKHINVQICICVHSRMLHATTWSIPSYGLVNDRRSDRTYKPYHTNKHSIHFLLAGYFSISMKK